MKDKEVRKSFWGVFRKLHNCKKQYTTMLKEWLERLPPKTRKRIVLAMLALFAALALYTFGKALYDLGKNDGRQMEVEHIRPLELTNEAESDASSFDYELQGGRRRSQLPTDNSMNYLIPDEYGRTEE